MNPTQSKQRTTQSPTNDSLVEQLRELSRGVGKTVKQDVIGGFANDALSSLFGTPKPQSGDMKPGHAVQLGKPATPPQEAAGGNFPRMPERFPFPFKRKEQFKPQFSPEQVALMRQKEAEVARKIDEIRIELKNLVSEIKTVDKEVQKAVDENMVDPGLYHLNYIDRLKTMLKNILKELKESRTWLNTHTSRKKQKGYWSQYKKKGTTFGLSHERVVATQTG